MNSPLDRKKLLGILTTIFIFWSFPNGLPLFWLIKHLSSYTRPSSLLKITSGAIIIVLTIWITRPDIVFAGFFKFTSAQTDTPRSESPQNLPIMQSHLSPMLLAQADITNPIIDEDAMSAPFSLYDEASLVIPERDTITTYVVQPGDTISQIADDNGVSINTIKWANKIPPKGTIKVGERLVILPITGVIAKVSKGDTLASIAKKYKADADDIASFNGLESGEKLTAGSQIIIPDGEISVPTEQITHSGGKSHANIPQAPTGQADTSGYYTKPVAGGILTQGYHDRYHAVDISIPGGHATGTPILAAASGTVIVANGSGWNGGYGELTIIQHDNGTQTLYAHQSKVLVNVGDHVEQGQKIGEIGSTGRSTGPHLHFELRGGLTPKFDYHK